MAEELRAGVLQGPSGFARSSPTSANAGQHLGSDEDGGREGNGHGGVQLQQVSVPKESKSKGVRMVMGEGSADGCRQRQLACLPAHTHPSAHPYTLQKHTHRMCSSRTMACLSGMISMALPLASTCIHRLAAPLGPCRQATRQQMAVKWWAGG